MFARLRLRLLIVTLILILAACGGSGGGDDVDDPAAGGNEGGSGDSETSTGDTEAPEIDPGSMPPAGEAHVEVNGETFIFRQSEMLERAFACEIRDDGATINFQSDRHDMLLQAGILSGDVPVANATVAPENHDLKYSTSRAPVAIEAPHVLLVGDFESSPNDDPGSFSDVGEGTIAVTCP